MSRGKNNILQEIVSSRSKYSLETQQKARLFYLFVCLYAICAVTVLINLKQKMCTASSTIQHKSQWMFFLHPRGLMIKMPGVRQSKTLKEMVWASLVVKGLRRVPVNTLPPRGSRLGV